MTELKVRTGRVTFGCEDLELAAEFRAAEAERPQPGVVLTGPFTGVMEQVVGTAMPPDPSRRTGGTRSPGDHSTR